MQLNYLNMRKTSGSGYVNQWWFNSDWSLTCTCMLLLVHSYNTIIYTGVARPITKLYASGIMRGRSLFLKAANKYDFVRYFFLFLNTPVCPWHMQWYILQCTLLPYFAYFGEMAQEFHENVSRSCINNKQTFNHLFWWPITCNCLSFTYLFTQCLP